MRSLSWPARLYVAVVALAGLAVIVNGPFTDIAWSPFVVLALLFLICESAPAILTPRRFSWTASTAATLAAVVLLGPVGAALVGTSTAFSVRRMLLVQRVFNAGMYALTVYAAGRVYVALGGHVGVPFRSSFPGIIGPFAVAAVVHVVANHGLLGGLLPLVRRSEGVARKRLAGVDFRVLLSDLGYAAFGLLIAGLWRAVGPFAAILVVLPLFVARWAMMQYAAQQRAYEATMAALCKAVETKDFYTRGHSERVSRGSSMLAKEIGMRADRLEAITYAGMLHDVGKLGVPTKVLQKSGKLTEEEYAAIQLHPMRGLEIVREIGFLDEALAGIMHHHERIDGRGYPLGLAGDEIPEFARVIAVADAFDSMTSTRSYRGARRIDEAIAELRNWSGSQFDPALVDAFVRALERDGWERPEQVAPPSGPADGVTAQDHDDPTAPLRVVENR
ncbi:MAG TPA: HD-GYP domain-containing protein [Streptosporangiaceae bacterium]